MLFLFGLALGVLSIILGYKIAGGDLILLWQPAEYIVVIGASLGSCIVANPLKVLIKSFKSLIYLFKSDLPERKDYLEVLTLFFNIFRFAKAKGNVEIEKHILDPFGSIVFQTSTFILNNISTLNFIINNLRLLTMGISQSSVVDNLVKRQITIEKAENENSAIVFGQLADSLPAIGIVAAVLGVIVTMKSLAEDKGLLGPKIAAALIGTFLGVAIAYVIVAPIARFLYVYMEKKAQFWDCIRIGIVSYVSGVSPIVITEIMRQSIPEEYRPSFEEVEKSLQEKVLKLN
jgi:chemotaxis protein MotA